MSDEKGAARPRQVTMAVAMGVISSVVLVLGLFETLERLRTPAMREVVDEFLAAPPGSSLGLETAQVVELMRALAFASGALAAAALVFAIYVLQRHRAARIGFSVIAALLLLTVPVTGLMPLFLGVAAFLLWSQPARDWYAGRDPAPAAAGAGRPAPVLSQSASPDRPEDRPQDRPQDRPEDRPQDAPGEQPTPQWAPPPWAPPQQSSGVPAPPPYGQGYGEPPDRRQPLLQEHPQPYGQEHQGYPAQPSRHPDKRPTTVTVASVLTWIGAGLTALMMLAFVAVLGTGGEAFVEEFERAAQDRDLGLSTNEVLAVGWAVAGTLLVWSLVSIVLAILAFRRSNAARIALAISAVMAALVSLVSILSLLSAVTLLLAGAAAIMLFTGGANQWYSRRSSSDDHRSGPPSGNPYAGHRPPDQYPQQYPDQYPQQSPPPPPAGRNQPW